jgi:hypothetical protein
MSTINRVLMICITFFISGCVTIGSDRFLLEKSVTFDQYNLIKQIIVEEAGSNGFGTLTSEIKPSEHNNWEGQLYFKLVTPNGTDQLFAEFSKKEGQISVYIHGAGTRSNPDSAAKAVRARLTKIGVTDGSISGISAPSAKAAQPEKNKVKTTNALQTQTTETQAAVIPVAEPKVETKPVITEKSSVTYLITTKSSCTVRSEPNGKSKVITTLKKGQKLKKIEKLENWYSIILPSGGKGWIHKDLVKDSD